MTQGDLLLHLARRDKGIVEQVRAAIVSLILDRRQKASQVSAVSVRRLLPSDFLPGARSTDGLRSGVTASSS